MAILKLEDYVVLVVTVLLSLGMGLYYSLKGEKFKTTAQYIMGDGDMAILPVALSLLVSYESGIMLLGIPAEVYIYGMQVLFLFVGFAVADLVSMYIFIPYLKNLEMTSIFEYLEVRYQSHVIRLFGTILSIIFGVNYMGTVLAMPAVTLKAVAGLDIWWSIVSLMAVVLIYTLIGGFKAVIYSDVIQAALMFGGMFAVIIKGTMDAGGLASTWQKVYETGRLNFFVFDVDPTVRQSFWSVFVGGFILGLMRPFMQTSFLRIKATPNIQTTQRMYLVSAILSLVIPILTTVGGAIMFAYYNQKGCDPLLSKQLDNSNQLMPAMVTEIFQDMPFLPGLFLSSLFSASLSTLSSILSSCSAVFWEDIVRPHTKAMSERRGIVITKLAVLGFGISGVAVAILVSHTEGPVIQIFSTTSGMIIGTMGGIFILGWTIPWANKFGALIGGATSVLLVGWITVGKMTSSALKSSPKLEPASMQNCPIINISSYQSYTNAYTAVQLNSTNVSATDLTLGSKDSMDGPHGVDVLYSLSFRWLGPMSILIVILIGAIASRMSERPTVAPGLVVPIGELICGCCPWQKMENVHCIVKYHKSTTTNLDEPETRHKMRDVGMNESG